MGKEINQIMTAILTFISSIDWLESHNFTLNKYQNGFTLEMYLNGIVNTFLFENFIRKRVKELKLPPESYKLNFYLSETNTFHVSLVFTK